MSYVVKSCIIGEPTEPRQVDGKSSWSSAAEAETALERYCELHGLDPDDFVVAREPSQTGDGDEGGKRGWCGTGTGEEP